VKAGIQPFYKLLKELDSSLRWNDEQVPNSDLP